jgi:V/A-type H+-transporting ATPase subunit E
MPEELENLLERIQKDGLEKADAEAGRILEKARAEADAILAKARTDAAAMVARAEKQASDFEDRARKTLRHASRDFMLLIGEALQSTLDSIVAREVASALDSRALGDIIQSLISEYFLRRAGGVEIILPESRRKEVADFLLARFREEIGKGIEIRGGGMVSGFKVREVNGDILHDLSAEAIADSLSKLLRPHLGEVVKQAVKEPGGSANP